MSQPSTRILYCIRRVTSQQDVINNVSSYENTKKVDKKNIVLCMYEIQGSCFQVVFHLKCVLQHWSTTSFRHAMCITMNVTAPCPATEWSEYKSNRFTMLNHAHFNESHVHSLHI